ncbi:helix-turn-helix transcriptional regulator [Nocardioides carbamazepini]|uniref:helix-turn-helix domain-containing protein n=1 Tax=Nocardioides carbamazepini TaxID=2854259 RepID=UPI00214A1548|nr:helix-turn-helix transcriptional regulator [Nocardioides carbamazepini]MCR1780974.1 helix-turn-helix transcriptional regulator [Nocardioides carbamazepini]
MTALVESPSVGPLLRSWRERRRFSQQELSNRSTVSTRHLSRVETGRAHPTPDMILHLAENLEVPLRDRNRLLLAAGYAPRYAEHSLEDGSLAVVMDGLRRLLDAHLPYPALLLDDYWDVVDANAAIAPFLAGCSPALLEPPINVVRLCLSEDGLADRIGNLDLWAGHLYHRAVGRAERTHDPRHHALAAEIAELSGGVPRLDPVTTGPVLTMELRYDEQLLRMFSTSAQLTTATDAALEGLALETFLPADEETRAFFTS